MPSEIAWMIVAVANPGQDEELEALAHRAAAWSKGNEPGVTENTWRVSPDTGAVVVHTRIASPEAARAHIANFEERFLVRFLACAKVQHTLVFGDPPPPVRKRLEALDPVYMRESAGFVRARPAAAPGAIR